MTVSYNCKGNGEVHLDVLKAICGGTSGKSMVDLGAGFAPQTRQLGFEERTYVDIVKRNLGGENENFVEADILTFIEADVLNFIEAIPICMTDVTFSLDSLEHFKKEDGFRILKWMCKNSKKQIVFTPLGDYLIEKKKTSNPDSHKSGWEPKEFEAMEWATIVFPNFHPMLGIGAFFAAKCENVEQEFKRIIKELNQKEWTK